MCSLIIGTRKQLHSREPSKVLFLSLSLPSSLRQSLACNWHDKSTVSDMYDRLPARDKVVRGGWKSCEVMDFDNDDVLIEYPIPDT